MKKFLKIFLAIVVLLVGLVIGAGFGMDPNFDDRGTYTIDAPIGKVWALVGDVRRTPEWLPTDMMQVDTVEVVTGSAVSKMAGALVDHALGGGTSNGKNGPTHIYHEHNGKSLEMQTVESVPKVKCSERVVGGTDDGATMFKSMSWGFEMEPDGEKTKLTMFSKSEASKPVCNTMAHVMHWIGMDKKFRDSMAKSIETAAKK